MVEILHNKYQLPVYQIEDLENIQNVLNSIEFNEIYSFYSEQLPSNTRLSALPDFEKRLGFYLYYTGQDQFLNQISGILYSRHMPTIEEFLQKDEYMGNSYAIVYPYWRSILSKIFDPGNQIFECVFRGSIGCLSGNAKILSNNKIITIEDLAKIGENNVFDVISYDIEKNKFVKTKAFNARCTGKDRKVISVSLSDGTILECTSDHRFLLASCKYVEAKDLKEKDIICSNGDSITVKSVEFLNKKISVYDIEVPGYHNFAVVTNSGKLIILHNSGKSTIARRGLLYTLYRICCLRNPHMLFKIAPDTVLSALMISVTKQHAEDTALKPMLEMIRNTPCFHEVRKVTAFDSFGPNDPVPYCKQGETIKFPNNVMLSIGSNINHIVGYSVFGCLTGDTEVVTDIGNIRIEDIAKSCKQYKVKTRELDGIFTWNNINHCECTKEVNELVEIELENGQTIRCTSDHKFPVEMVDSISKKNLIFYCGQWCKKAKDLKIFDNLIGCKIKNVRLNLLKQPVKVYNLEVNNILHNYLLSSGIVTCNSVFDEAEEKDSTEAFSLYTGLRERIRSRFLNSSLIYCALISSSKSKSGMVWEYIHKIKPNDPETLLLDPAIWEVKGEALALSGKKFWIYVGTKTHPSKVLPEEYNDVPFDKLNYVPPAGCDLMEVPIEYKREFENNIEAAIQNIAGRTTDTSDRPFDDLSLLGDCKNLIPEIHLEAPLGDPIPLIEKLPKDLFQMTTFGMKLARYPSAPRFCFTADTKVQLLSGVSKTMKELTEDYKNGVDNFVYSWDCNKNKWCVGKIIFSGVTKLVNKLAKITLDDGSIIKCTPDHKFLLKTGIYKPVSEIDFNESLLALYKKESELVSYKRKSYEQILNPITKSWDYTHKISADFYNENFENARMLANSTNSSVVIHHKDFNASNNDPNNLIFLEKNQHLKVHSNSKENALSKLWQLSSFRNMMLIISSNNGKVNGKCNMLKNWKNENFVAKMKIVNSENGKKNIVKYNKSESRRKKISELCKIGKIGLKTLSKEKLRLGNLNCRRKIIIKNIEYLNSLGLELTKENWENNRYCKNVPCWNKMMSLSKEDFGDLINLFVVNHKIKKIEYINYENPIEVYDLTVENKENTHNFTLAAGVVVSNCHVDLASQSSSQAGYSLWHKEYRVNSVGEREIVFVADFISWITAPNRIDHDAIKKLSLDLRDKAGVYIKTISYDQYQCLAGDVEICILNGDSLTIKEIVNRFGEKGFNPKILTFNLKTKKYEDALISAVRESGKKRLALVYLSNGKIIRCSNDHRFLLDNGFYVHASDLKPRDKLKNIPFKFRSVFIEKVIVTDRYEEMYDISIESDKEPNFALTAGVFVHNSEYVRQSLQQNHEFENVKYQSVDRDITAYLNFAQWLISGRIKIGDCPYLREQLGHIGVFEKKITTTKKKDMADSCLSFDTKVFLLSGKVLTIEELYNSDISHEWILACDVENKKLIPVKIENVLQKHTPKFLYQITLSNGKTISLTEDHLILMRNGEYKRADKIEVSDELMPFNYYHELNYHDRYRKVVNPFNGVSKFLYKIVSKEFLSESIALAKKRAIEDGSKFTVIHHKSHNKNDDRPENLVPLTNIEHTSLHAMTGKEIKAFHDRTVFKRARSKIINEGLELMKKVNPNGYRKYLMEHDIADKLSEQKAKIENLRVFVTQINLVENNKPVYDIVLNTIHNFALDCNVFVHNCVGAVNNAYLDTTPVEFPFVEEKSQEVSLKKVLELDETKQNLIEI